MAKYGDEDYINLIRNLDDKSLSKLREMYPLMFQKGSYRPLEINGKFRKHIISFARNYENQWLITIIPRFLTDLISSDAYPFGEKVWDNINISLPENSVLVWKDIFTEQRITANNTLFIRDALKYFPVASLYSEK